MWPKSNATNIVILLSNNEKYGFLVFKKKLFFSILICFNKFQLYKKIQIAKTNNEKTIYLYYRKGEL